MKRASNNFESTFAIARDADQLDAVELAALCRALAHPARVTILRHLMREDRCICGSIVKILPLAQSTVSQHLKILKEAGLVQGEVAGPATCYCVDKKRLAAAGAAFAALFNREDKK